MSGTRRDDGAGWDGFVCLLSPGKLLLISRRRRLILHCLCFTPSLHLAGASEEMAPPIQQNFMIPKKEINIVSDMGKWKRSQVWLRVQGNLASARPALGTATGENQVWASNEKLIDPC